MKKTYSIYVAIFIVIIAILLFGGKKNNTTSNISSEIINDSQSYYGKVIRLSDFPEEKLLTVEYMDEVNYSVMPDDVGGSPENALVALVFDKDFILYTANRFNEDLDNSNLSGITEYLTDLQTFRKMTGLKEASEEYTQFMNNAKGEKIWIFDAYVKFFGKKKVKKKQI